VGYNHKLGSASGDISGGEYRNTTSKKPVERSPPPPSTTNEQNAMKNAGDYTTTMIRLDFIDVAVLGSLIRLNYLCPNI